MGRGYEGRSAEADEAEPAHATFGRRTQVASRYPALAARLGDAADAPTIHDAATAAVEHKGGGAAVDPGVAARVGSYLGADFAGVRVHDDPLSQQATAAMGARAFAYGGDVFLGPDESGRDLGLMAHELTHVAQQGAAGQRAIQRAVQVGAADSPAEREADQVSAAVTGGHGRPGALLVDDGPVAPGQMLKSQFFDQLRGAVAAATEAELGPAGAGIGCPPIEQFFQRCAAQPAAAGVAQLQGYAPGTRGATSAAALIPIIVARVHEGVRQWRETGQAPDQLAGALPADGPAAAAMGAGHPMDPATASRMIDALGADVAGAQIHIGPQAQAFADRHGARAVAVGSHIAFAAGAYRPGTLEGDALLAHELGHVAQQKGAGEAVDPGAAPEAGAALEDDADRSAAGAVARLWSGAANVGRRAAGALRSGLALARCPNHPAVNLDRVPAGPARQAAIAMAAASAPIEQNTARQLADGTITVFYMEDCAHPPNEAAILAAQHPPLDPAVWTVLVHPREHTNMLVQRNFVGFQPDAYRGDIFGQRALSVDRWRTLLIHETNHARNAVPGNVLERYRSEFRAYWVAEFAHISDLDERARQVRQHILADYPPIRAAYDSDPATKTAIDGITRPDGNTDNH
jgi:hypothetical protein